MQTPSLLPPEIGAFFPEAAAAERLSQLLAGRAEYNGLKVTEVLRVVRDREVFIVRLPDGRKAVLKRFIGGNVPQLVRNVQAEFDFAAKTMGAGTLQCVRCLAAEPELGFVVLSHAPGKPLEALLRRADPARRRRLIRQAGEWLAAYTAPRRKLHSFAPAKWLDWCRAQDRSGLAVPDRALVAELEAALARRLEAHAGRRVTHAATHADLTPRNLHFHRGTLIGLDIQGEAWLAVARDAAIFLIWMAGHCPEPPGGRCFGLARADVEAFLEGGAVPKEEAETVLPFFVGVQLHQAIVRAQEKTERLRRLREAIAGFVSEPVVA